MKGIIALVVLFLFFSPMVCMASTPPVQPSLLFDIPNPSPTQNAPLDLSVTWNGYVSYNKPPEQIIVFVFVVPDGSRLGSFPIPKSDDVCASESTCMYRTSLNAQDFPPGTFMLIATDPLSGASNRQVIAISPHRDGNSGFFKNYELGQMFLILSGVLGAFLIGVLAILVRKKAQ
ncbi:MAG: hypothetical protein M0Q91_02140 [Methanoregula sp.]|jgi:hypothetical protein|nr:hypothetical protein [Methanoregula sp.]